MNNLNREGKERKFNAFASLHRNTEVATIMHSDMKKNRRMSKTGGKLLPNQSTNHDHARSHSMNDIIYVLGVFFRASAFTLLLYSFLLLMKRL